MLTFGCDLAALGVIGIFAGATWKLGSGMVAVAVLNETDKQQRAQRAAEALTAAAALAAPHGDELARVTLQCTVVGDAQWVHVALLAREAHPAADAQEAPRDERREGAEAEGPPAKLQQ